MTRLIVFLLFLTCTGITAAWIAENPGNVTMLWFDYRIETSFAFILLLSALTALILASLYVFLHHLLRAPTYLSRRRRSKNYEKGITELTHSIVALAAADEKAADIHTRKAEKLLGSTPLTLLLSAQVARMQGDDSRTQQLLENMLGHKETEYLAARYLSETASKHQQLPQARDMARRASKLNPKGLEPLLSLHIRLKEWQEAFIAINSALRKGQITRTQLHHFKSVVYAQQALSLLDQNQDETALIAARNAWKEAPSNIPALQILTRAYIATQRPQDAIKIILNAWKKQPHILLIESLRLATARMPQDKQIKLTQKLATYHPTHHASHIALAQTYLAASQWEKARASAKQAMSQSETTQACKLMAEIEIGEYADYDAHGRWLSRGANATPDGNWVCNSCAHTNKNWDAHCPACHSFDTLEWKQRELTFVG